MSNLGAFPGIEALLRAIGLIAAALFLIYVIVFFARTAWRDGILTALVRVFSFQITIPLLVVVALNLFVFALVFVRPQEIGVVISFPTPGGVRPYPLRGGFHLIVPFMEQVRKYPYYWQTYTMGHEHGGDTMGVGMNGTGNGAILARTRDQQEILIDCSLIYRIDPDQAVLVHTDWQDRYPNDLLRPLTRSIVRRQISQYNVDEVNSTARLELESSIDNALRIELADKGFVLDQFLLRNITFSEEYARAVERKQVAFEEQTRAEYEAERERRLAQGRADAVVIEAQGRADGLALIGESLNEYEGLLTYRYIEQLAPNIRVMLLPNNAPFILPLNDALQSTDGMTATTSLSDTLTLPNPPSNSSVNNGSNPDGTNPNGSLLP